MNASQFGVKGQGRGGIKYAGKETTLAGPVNTMSWKVLVGFSPVMYCGTNALNFGVRRS